jgi:hypothetical protein
VARSNATLRRRPRSRSPVWKDWRASWTAPSYLPGTNIRVGLDVLIGLVPVAGDIVSGLVSSYLIWEARRLKVPKWVIGRMVANTFLDTTLGAIPILGDLLDVAFRANMQNMALLRRHMEKRGLTAAGGPVIQGDAIRVR